MVSAIHNSAKKLLSEWRQLNDQSLHETESGAQNLLEFWSRAEQDYRNHNRREANNWNIFDVLGISHLETALHTPFLRELFDSQGSHGQGTLFFRQLLRELSRHENGIKKEEINTYAREPFDDGYFCREEVADPISGRLDLIIECSSGKDAFCIIIENKIHAAEQHGQLARYKEYLDKHIARADRRFLVYLHARDENHVPATDLRSILILRYQVHIRRMLNDCLSLIKASAVRMTVDQYLAVIDAI